MPASMSLQTVKGNEKWFQQTLKTKFYYTFKSTTYYEFWAIEETTLWTNSYQFCQSVWITVRMISSCLFPYWSTNRMINQIMHFNKQQLTRIYHLNQMVLHFPCPLFPVRFRIHINNEAHQPYMIHQSTSKILNNAIKINYQPTRAI